MKIRSVALNNRKKHFVIRTAGKELTLPYAMVHPAPTAHNGVARIFVDPELGRKAWTYELESGASGTVHIEEVLEYNHDPRYMRDLILCRLTLEARERVAGSGLSKREIVRRLGTSAPQLYRLLDPTNYRKSIDQILGLLQVLNCDVELVVRGKTA